MQSDRDWNGAIEARPEFGDVLDRVEHGESIVITRHGTPVARLVPFHGVHDPAKVRRAIDRLRELRKGMRLGGLSIRALIDEGRR